MFKSCFNHSQSGNFNPSKDYLEKRRQAITPVPHENETDSSTNSAEKYSKKPEEEAKIKTALESSDFLDHVLQGNRLQNVIDSLQPRDVSANEIIIKEDENGSHLYISHEGQFEISQKGNVIATFNDARVFGELALLYDAKRLATIKSKSNGRIWSLDRATFKKIMVRSDIEEHEEMESFLRAVPEFEKIDENVLEHVANLFQVEFFSAGTEIIREGEKGEKFYIIRAGSVTVTTKQQGLVDRLHRGQFFGELALLGSGERRATVTAAAPGSECLTLTKQEFIDHFGEAPDLIGISYEPLKPMQDEIEYAEMNLEDLKIIGLLGQGGFGKVKLVKHKLDQKLVFALKMMAKRDVIEERRREHVFNEKNVHIACRDVFIVRLYRTFRDEKYLYLVQEACLGGDLWNLSHRQTSLKFDEIDAKFYVGCVVEAFSYLREHGIVYRDLKPENLLIDSKGYVKLTDFGFAKRLEIGKKTYSFVGTPEYVSPEMILNRGYDKAVDCWALGIFIFELLCGYTPFKTTDTSYMRTYKLILRGIEHVKFPNGVSSKAKSIVKKLCQHSPTARLGCLKNGMDDIRKHEWFGNVNWVKLHEQTIIPPFKPNLRNNTDMRYFDKVPKDNDIPPDMQTSWEYDF